MKDQAIQGWTDMFYTALRYNYRERLRYMSNDPFVNCFNAKIKRSFVYKKSYIRLSKFVLIFNYLNGR